MKKETFTFKKNIGNIQFLFENGAIRYLKIGHKEILRNVYFALRDHNWGTIPFRIENFTKSSDNQYFKLNFTAIHSFQNRDILSWNVAIKGQVGTTLTYEISGDFLEDFQCNRAGFCVLHPVEECAGKKLKITQPDGTVSEEIFPKWIAPHRPVPYIRQMTWWLDEFTEATLHFEGDDFEMEDHRNWTDTSYKTFCTPLSLPFPVPMKKGEKVHQKITLAIKSETQSTENETIDSIIKISTLDHLVNIPKIGTLQSFEKNLPNQQEIEQLKSLHLDHLRVEIDLEKSDWESDLEQGITEANLIQTDLFLSLTFGENILQQMNDFIGFAQNKNLSIKYILLFQHQKFSTPHDVLFLIFMLRKTFPNTKFGAGVQSNYAELGRNIFVDNLIHFVSYGIQPQEHAFDNLSLIENVESQADTVHSARELYPKKEVFVSPLTLKKRFNPYTKNPEERFTEQPLVIQKDDRLVTDFGLVWLLGSLQTLSEAEASVLTIFRSHGDLGIVQPNSKLIDFLKKIQNKRDWKIRLNRSSDKLACGCLILEKEEQREIILSNFTQNEITVEIFDKKIILKKYETLYI